MSKKKSRNGIGRPKIREFKIGDVRPAKYNPRVISEAAMKGLAASLERFGCVEPIIVNVKGGRNTIVGGNQRFRILRATGVKKIVCVTVNLLVAEEKLLNITLNNPHAQGEFIAELDEYIERLREQLGDDELLLQMRIDELRDDLGRDEKTGLVLDDEVPKPPKKTIVKRGDLWQLGDHRLVCGDSTLDEDVARLMAGKKASLFSTDPPYCVDYTGKDRPGGGKDWSDSYHETDIPDIREFMRQFYNVAFKHVKPKAAMYLWHASSRIGQIQEVCNELGILIHQQIIWVKPCSVLSFSMYPWRHEPCLLMWKRGSKPSYSIKGKSVGTVWTVGYIKRGDPTTPEYYTDVWEVDWAGKKRNPGIEHPIVKPVELFSILMRVHTRPGDICFEPFCGSGSQIIAAEKLGRRCFAIELEEVFCDVTIKRWEEWTGKKAKKVTAGTRGRKK